MVRTVTFTMPDGETLRDELTKTDNNCLRCGTRGVWVTGDGHLLCSTCRTVMPDAAAAYQASPDSPFGQMAKALAT